MPALQHQPYSAPFDAVAARYDATFTQSTIGQAQRAAVWRELVKAFHSGDRVLEIGCGTGVDACFLAQRGVSVMALDSSPEMIAVATRRVHNSQAAELVQPRVLRAEDISTLPGDGLFDGAFSNFGAMNCVDNLRCFARDLARLLQPGASALLCWMGPCCLWEILWYLARLNARKAFRRIARDGVTARIAEDAQVRVHYPSVRRLCRMFAPEFRLRRITGVGLAVPPSYVEAWAARHARLLKTFESADVFLGQCPGIRALADHVLLRFERTHYRSAER